MRRSRRRRRSSSRGTGAGAGRAKERGEGEDTGEATAAGCGGVGGAGEQRREEAPLAEGEWRCALCTFVNAPPATAAEDEDEAAVPVVARCAMCDAAREALDWEDI